MPVVENGAMVVVAEWVLWKRYTVVAIVDMARETACEERWRGQSERLQTMAPARHSSGSEKLEMAVNSGT